jgi:hypothetical protein
LPYLYVPLSVFGVVITVVSNNASTRYRFKFHEILMHTEITPHDPLGRGNLVAVHASTDTASADEPLTVPAAEACAHKMYLAKPSSRTARRLGLSSNHHARVWCSCMDNPSFPPGQFSHRASAQVLADPRRLGSFDALGVVDLRVPNSALDFWKGHLK